MDILISQYFRLKLESVRAILDAVNALGFILTPVALGHNIVKLGILQVITWYQAIILQGILISIAVRKPKYLKSQKTKYRLIRVSSFLLQVKVIVIYVCTILMIYTSCLISRNILRISW